MATRDEQPKRVLIIDDSAFMRRAIARIISEGQGLEVVGTAASGKEGLAQIAALKPDVVTLDVEMPEMDGVQVLEQIMARHPMPVVMLSSLTRRGAEITLKCLELGALDFIAKPSGSVSEDLTAIRYIVWMTVRNAAAATVTRPMKAPAIAKPLALPERSQALARRLVVIGASTGGPRALLDVLETLPADLPASVVIIQHMPAHFTATMAQRFDSRCALDIREAREGDRLVIGAAYVAPGGLHLHVTDARTLALSTEPPLWGVRPCVDYPLEDAAQVYRSACLGVVLTGMGRDGTTGLTAIKQYGGATVVQDAATCVVYGMPRSAVEAGVVDLELPLPAISEQIVAWSRTGRLATPVVVERGGIDEK